MSDFRRFCITYFVCTTLLVILEWIGVETKYTGLEALVARSLIALGFGVAVVALWGRPAHD